MVLRKGELTSAGIDREWPHQVALPAEAMIGKNVMIIDRFCRGLSICPRHHNFRLADGKEYFVYCFATLGDADYFRIYFGGEPMTPETRPSPFPKVPRRTKL